MFAVKNFDLYWRGNKSNFGMTGRIYANIWVLCVQRFCFLVFRIKSLPRAKFSSLKSKSTDAWIEERNHIHEIFSIETAYARILFWWKRTLLLGQSGRLFHHWRGLFYICWVILTNELHWLLLEYHCMAMDCKTSIFLLKNVKYLSEIATLDC